MYQLTTETVSTDGAVVQGRELGRGGTVITSDITSVPSGPTRKIRKDRNHENIKVVGNSPVQ